MPDLQLSDGRYIIGAHIGFRIVLTSTQHTVELGAPVIAAPELIPPIPQEWRIKRADQSLPGQYFITPLYNPKGSLVYANDVLWTNDVAPASWVIKPTPSGMHIVSDKGLALRAEPIGAQVRLAPEDNSPNEAWSLHFLGPIIGDEEND
ncbi:hypothetical protein ACFXKR_36945 [Streptomyces violascens]|uniref:hypothetical protein n=1 Tax=Streptomyces violascens TaxID=67381 RepID=UPI003678D5C4